MNSQNPTKATMAQFVAMMQDAIGDRDNARTADQTIVHSGSKIILPAVPKEMTPGEAVVHLQRLERASNQTVSICEVVHGANPYDGAVSFRAAADEIFGWVTPEAKETFFGSRPPNLMTIMTSATESVEVFWGNFTLPGLEGTELCTGVTTSQLTNRASFCVQGTVKRKDVHIVKNVVARAQELLKSKSIYRGKAIQLKQDEIGDVFDAPPKFVDTTLRDPLILPDLIQRSVEANLFALVEHTTECAEAGIPLKRGVLLEGRPGTGKSLTAQHLASRATRAGWTYILLEDARGLAAAIDFAQDYAPAVIFAEDIDRVVSGKRDISMDELFNSVDGVSTKMQQLLLVFTSNNISGIERTMIRPGRIDTIINFGEPDAATTERFIRTYASTLLAADADLKLSVEALKGQIPAIVREAVERAKLYAISRGVKARNLVLTDADIFEAAQTLQNHTNFFHSERKETKSPEEVLGEAFAAVVRASMPPTKKAVPTCNC